MDIYFKVAECNKHGRYELDHEFPSLDKAAAFVDERQREADLNGNPREVCFEVYPTGNVLYYTVPAQQSRFEAAA